MDFICWWAVTVQHMFSQTENANYSKNDFQSSSKGSSWLPYGFTIKSSNHDFVKKFYMI